MNTEKPDAIQITSLNQLAWLGAIGEAKIGYPDRLAKRLRDPEATLIPEAREYLAAIIEGSQRPPVRDTRTKLPPRLMAQMKSTIFWMEQGKAMGILTPAQYRRQKNALIAELAATTGAKPIVVTKRWNAISAEESKKAKELAAIVRHVREPGPQRTVYRMGKCVKVES